MDRKGLDEFLMKINNSSKSSSSSSSSKPTVTPSSDTAADFLLSLARKSVLPPQQAPMRLKTSSFLGDAGKMDGKGLNEFLMKINNSSKSSSSKPTVTPSSVTAADCLLSLARTSVLPPQQAPMRLKTSSFVGERSQPPGLQPNSCSSLPPSLPPSASSSASSHDALLLETFVNQNGILWERIHHYERTIKILEDHNLQLQCNNTRLEVDLKNTIEMNKNIVQRNTTIALDSSVKDTQLYMLREQKKKWIQQNSNLKKYLRQMTDSYYIGSIQNQQQQLQVQQQQQMQRKDSSTTTSTGRTSKKRKRAQQNDDNDSNKNGKANNGENNDDADDDDVVSINRADVGDNEDEIDDSLVV